jgi:hypothetical protein
MATVVSVSASRDGADSLLPSLTRLSGPHSIPRTIGWSNVAQCTCTKPQTSPFLAHAGVEDVIKHAVAKVRSRITRPDACSQQPGAVPGASRIVSEPSARQILRAVLGQ